jgi:hypothetical protein
MVVAMPLMRMMQVALHQIIGVVTVRDGFVSAPCAVGMFTVMLSACMAWGTGRRVRAALLQSMLIYVSSVRAVKVPVVQIVNVSFVFDPGVPTAGTMRM